MRAVLESGHFPLGMELRGAADEEQWQIIARQIDVADYYVVIVAPKYGSLDGKISWTEREYDYALNNEVPILGFLLKDGAPWKTDQIEKAGENNTGCHNKRRRDSSFPGHWLAMNGVMTVK